MTELVIGTFNLQCTIPNDSEAQAGLLKENSVDICALQEINFDNYRFGPDRFNSLSAFTKGNNSFADYRYAPSIEFAHGTMGIGMVSEIPVQGSETIKLYSEDAKPETIAELHKCYNDYDPQKPETLEALKEFNRRTTSIEPRVAIRSEFKIGDKSLAFYATHLSFETEALRHTQLVQLRNMLRKDSADYTILAGDLNVDQSTKELDFLRDEFTLSNGNGGVWYDTFSGIDENMRVNSVDNIILSKNIRLLEAKMIPTDLSDHQLLTAKIELS
ncbi:endonuclease/exonuclease/phosphatase family protein [Bifidobacterium sp. ESL0690]|uniref:endonuclease/exonuclease/phosphatase family protein n=1 Tax=Bifidobacterium sp. ESL0690 TaxID=2983214 RepID=UPI0023F6EF08|nr:endonuclease/exonuclease/phosphatase family protein [Bifidobacterium sp. ESL0690]WEV47574.1 endonuclease/exonuclease/phosphatase family protein [Bifidobacterium sp. ESL0690]